MKHLFTAAAMLFSIIAFAQVGINNTSPKATLDITAKTTDGSKPEGLIAPRLKGNEIQSGTYGSDQKGAIIYATTAATAPNAVTTNITQSGYYYFDGSVWQKVITGSVANSDLTTGAGGIYKGSGSLSGNTTVTQGANTLAFTSTATNGFSVDGTTLSVDAANHRLGIGTTSPSSKLDVNGGVKIGNDASTCSAANQGTLKYVGGQCYLCNGTSWSPFAIASPQVAVVKSTTGFPAPAVMDENMTILSQQVPISTAGFTANSISATLGNDGVRDFIKLPAAGVYQINFSTFGSCYNFNSISAGVNGTGLNVSIYKAPNNNTYTLLESYRSSAFTPYAIVAQSNYNTQLNASFVVSVSSNDKLAFQLDFIKNAAAGNTCTCGGVQTLPTGGTFTSQIIVNKL
ncbi:hypothetical protein [Chryseobacterium taeanense]|uniref:hypothetical protein n=1 Tax=Chryseobacterium taeanense TaxID=311334 RepID=UPI0035B2F5F6